MESEKKETKKRGRKKKAPEKVVDNEITRIAMLAISGAYGKGKFMQHRLQMNYGKSKTAEILKEIDKISKMIVK